MLPFYALLQGVYFTIVYFNDITAAIGAFFNQLFSDIAQLFIAFGLFIIGIPSAVWQGILNIPTEITLFYNNTVTFFFTTLPA
jgi:hypothetical protein